MIRKRYRVTVDVDVDIHDITFERAQAREAEREAARLAEGRLLETEPRIPVREDIDACRALQLEFLKDTALLDTWLREQVLTDTVHELYETAEMSGRQTHELMPAIERLPPWARHWWRETMSAEDDLGERVDEFYDSITISSSAPRVFKLKRPAGDG